MSRHSTVAISGPRPPTTLGRASAAVRPFRTQHRTMLAVVVKATFQIVPKHAMSPLSPAPVVDSDQHDASANGAVSAASETAPFLRRADILLTGRAFAPGGQPSQLAPVRLRLGLGNTVLLDKTLHVCGDRPGNGSSPPQPFVSMPLGYDRALGGAADPDNPVGRDPQMGAAANVFDPKQPTGAAGFGPIASHWPARARCLGSADPRALQAHWPLIPDDFDWSYFQAAPLDQQTPYLTGGEWIVLQGFHAEMSRIESWLPAPRAEARLHLPAAGEPQSLPLVADMLVIDAERLVCSMIWRANAPLPSNEALVLARVSAKVALPDEEVAWDDDATGLPFRGDKPPPSAQPKRAAKNMTMIGGEAPTDPGGGLPFAGSAPAPLQRGTGTGLLRPEEIEAARRPDTPFNVPTPGAPPPPAVEVPIRVDTGTIYGAGLIAETPRARAAATLVAPAPMGTGPIRAEDVAAALRSATPFNGIATPAPPPAPWLPVIEDTGTVDLTARALQGLLREQARSSPAIAVPYSPPISSVGPSAVPAMEVAAPVPPPAPAAALGAARKERARVRPREPRVSSAPLVSPRERRPAKVAADGLGASFLRSQSSTDPKRS